MPLFEWIGWGKKKIMTHDFDKGAAEIVKIEWVERLLVLLVRRSRVENIYVLHFKPFTKWLQFCEYAAG